MAAGNDTKKMKKGFGQGEGNENIRDGKKA
jgi:hypothetical protein